MNLVRFLRVVATATAIAPENLTAHVALTPAVLRDSRIITGSGAGTDRALRHLRGDDDLIREHDASGGSDRIRERNVHECDPRPVSRRVARGACTLHLVG